MPRVVFQTNRHVFENALPDEVKYEIENIVRKTILDAFPTLDGDERNVETRWVVDERSTHTNELTVDVMYTVGQHGFGFFAKSDGFTKVVRQTIFERLGERFFPKGDLVSVDAWILPQEDACWGSWCRAEAQKK